MKAERTPNHSGLGGREGGTKVFRLQHITADERLIVEAAIMMCEYLVEYAADSPCEDPPDLLPLEEIREACAKRAEDRKKYPIHWKFEDFERLICSGGFELSDGRLVPRF